MGIYIKFIFVLVFLYTCFRASWSRSPNIVFILTDDQDVEIGGMKPMKKVKELISDAGIIFNNAFVTSPLCCPSRSSILTGNYTHNNGALNNSVSGNCSSPAWQQESEPHTFAAQLHRHGYRTFFAGKYLNQYGKKVAGGVEHVPRGWDEWHGLVGNSVYYNYALSVNGKREEHGADYEKDYLTKLIADRAVSFIDHFSLKPFMMMLSTPACHAPFTPAPQYSKNFSNVSAPRNGSFNFYDPDRHWLARSVKHPLSNESIRIIDETYRNRWRTLLSVDDLVELVINALDRKKLLDNTYVIFMSDNGYHLGQLSFPYDKRQLYEFDIRVPLMVRGPGIKPGQVRQEIILNIDIAPTLVDLAGVPNGSAVISDGQSFKALLTSNMSAEPPSQWRTQFLVEHDGEFQDVIKGCPDLSNQNVANCFPDCVCEDSLNNTYVCVRAINSTLNVVYCQFADAESYVEMYDLQKDPFQLKNVRDSADPNLLMELNKRLLQLSVCSGQSCHNLDSPRPFCAE